jgi:hypothetical protein
MITQSKGIVLIGILSWITACLGHASPSSDWQFSDPAFATSSESESENPTADPPTANDAANDTAATGNAASVKPLSFDTQILPLLTKHGCNAGECHGAAAGRGNFSLSLFGSDPAADYQAIVRAFRGRRIRLADPESSLLIAKPTGRIAHGGDVLFEPDSPTASALAQWISRGAARGQARRLDALHVEAQPIHASPTQRTTTPPQFQLRAFAHFESDEAVDVTAWTQFTLDPESGIDWDENTSTATLRRPGRHHLLARYTDRVVPVVMIHPYPAAKNPATASPATASPATDNPATDSPATDETSFATNPARSPWRHPTAPLTHSSHWIDEPIDQGMRELNLEPSPVVDDLTWLRRVSLDLTGRLPTMEQIQAMANDTAPDRRAAWIQRLLDSDGYVDLWSLRWARWLGLHALPNEPRAAQAYADWIRRAVAEDRSYQEMARELLTSTGDSHDAGAANFSRMVGDPRAHAELVARVFLGSRLQCANCHNHPFDRWTQDDYHGLAAVFAGVERGRTVQFAERGQITNLRTKEPALPRLPGSHNLSETPTQASPEHIHAFTQWLTDADHPAFAKVMVNRVWGTMLGHGLVDPVDDFRETNPASHPDLLDALAQSFRESGYRIRPLVAAIAASHAYARSCQPPESNHSAIPEHLAPSTFARGLARPLPPEVLLDAVHDGLGVQAFADANATVPTRAVHLLDPLAPHPTLDILGRCNRTQSCNDSDAPFGLARQLHWINGDVVNQALSSRKTFFDVLLAAGAADETIVTQSFLRILSRYPRPEELQSILPRIPAPSDARHAWFQDWLWSLLSSTEFLTNH